MKHQALEISYNQNCLLSSNKQWLVSGLSEVRSFDSFNVFKLAVISNGSKRFLGFL